MTTSADQDLGTERPVQVLPGPVQQRACVQGGHTEHQPELDVMAASEIQRLDLGRAHAGHGVPGHQPGIGIQLARTSRRLIGFSGRHRPSPTALDAGQRVEPR